MFGNKTADPGKVAHVLDLRNRLRDAVVRVFDLPDTTRCLKVSLEMGALPEEIEDFRTTHFNEVLDAPPNFYYGLDGMPVVSYRVWCQPTMRRYCLHHLNLEIAQGGTIKISLLAEFKETQWSNGKDVELPVNKIRAELMPEGWPNSALLGIDES